MAYSAIATAQARVRGAMLLSTTSTPTLAQATAFGAGITGEIDTALASHGITTPVTTPAAFLAWLVEVETVGWAARIASAMFADDAGENSDEQVSRLDRWYQNAMKRIWDGSAIPPTLGLGAASLPASYTTRYPDEQPDLGDIVLTAFGSDWAT